MRQYVYTTLIEWNVFITFRQYIVEEKVQYETTVGTQRKISNIKK